MIMAWTCLAILYFILNADEFIGDDKTVDPGMFLFCIAKAYFMIIFLAFLAVIGMIAFVIAVVIEVIEK